MTDGPVYIAISDCVNEEDGSSTFKLEMGEKARDYLIEEGLKLVLHCAACEVDLADVYNWIEAQGVAQ